MTIKSFTEYGCRNIDIYFFARSRLNVFLVSNPLSAKGAMHDRRSPIIIDNTNIQAWEMKPYVKMVGGDVT